jgi:hypothetical protein
MSENSDLRVRSLLAYFVLFYVLRDMCSHNSLCSIIPYPISDSIWLANGSLLVGAGHQMFLFGEPNNDTPPTAGSDSLFEYAARNNGPLEDYHPQMLLQCLLWGTY